MNASRLSIAFVSLSILAGISAAPQKSDKKNSVNSTGETIAKPLTDKEKRKRDEKLRKELETPYRKWLNEDVSYIITDEERTAFKRLQTDEEREQFIEQFWLRRDPTPDTVENEFKEEHYRRIAYTNENFAPAFPAGRPIAAASTSPTARLTRRKPTPPAAPMNGPWKKAAAPPPPSPSNSGATATSKASAPTSILNSWIPPCRASTA